MSHSVFKIPNNTEDLIKLLNERHESLVKARAGYDHQARINLAFMRGHQHLVDAGSAAQPHLMAVLPDPESDDPRERTLTTVNKIGEKIDRIVAKMTKGAPVPECRPVTMTESDISAARVGTRILASEAHRLNLNALLARLYYWVIPCGTAFLHVTWDPKDGEVIGKGTRGQKLHIGNVGVGIVPSFEIVMNADARDMLSARWCIQEIAMYPEEIAEEYNVEVTSGPEVRTIEHEMSMLANNNNTTNEGYPLSVKRFWLKADANRSQPEGMCFTWCGDTVLKKPDKFPFEHNHLPYPQFNYLPPLEGPFGRTPVTDVIDIQRDANHARSRKADIRDRLVPKLLAMKNQVDPDLISDLVEVITYNPGAQPPTYLDIPSGWQVIWDNDIENADAEIGKRLGITPASEGGLAGTSPGVTVLSQQEAAAEPLAIPAEGLARGLAEYGWQHLMLVKENWEEKRVVRTWSETGRLEVDRFKKSDLGKQLDVHVTPESALPRSKAARTQMAIEFWQNGMITDPRLFVKLLDLPSTDVLATTFEEDARHAEEENDLMSRARLKTVEVPVIDEATGNPEVDVFGEIVTEPQQTVEGQVPVEDWHNHEVHVKIHNSFRKTPEFRQMSEVVQRTFEAHVKVHQEILGTLMARQMGLMEDQQPGPGGEPQPGAAAPGTSQIAPPSETGAPSQGSRPPIPSVTKLAQIGGRAGRPGAIPGISPDDIAGAIGE